MSAEPFDLEDAYDADVSPLMRQVIDACTRHGIQMTASFCYSRDKGGEEGLCTTALPGPCRTLELAARLIERGVQEHQIVEIVPPSILAITVTTEPAT